MMHELKAWPESFEPVWAGVKHAEFRKDDRGFKAGDVLLLKEWIPGKCEYTGRELHAVVTHAMAGPSFAVPEGFAMLSIEVRVKSSPSDGPSGQVSER